MTLNKLTNKLWPFVSISYYKNTVAGLHIKLSKAYCKITELETALDDARKNDHRDSKGRFTSKK